MKSISKGERYTILIGIAGVLITALGVVVHLYIWNLEDKESLSIQLVQQGSFLGDNTRELIVKETTETEISKLLNETLYEAWINIPIEFIISNNGKKTISIVDFDCFSYFQPFQKPSVLVDKNGDQIITPFSINPGDSKRLKLLIEMSITQESLHSYMAAGDPENKTETPYAYAFVYDNDYQPFGYNDEPYHAKNRSRLSNSLTLTTGSKNLFTHEFFIDYGAGAKKNRKEIPRNLR